MLDNHVQRHKRERAIGKRQGIECAQHKVVRCCMKGLVVTVDIKPDSYIRGELLDSDITASAGIQPARALPAQTGHISPSAA